jgi:hypothetical protein
MAWPKGKQHSLEHRQKLSKTISERNKRSWKDPVYREKMIQMLYETGTSRGLKIGISKKGNKYCLGRKVSPETIEKIRRANLGQRRSEEARAKIRLNTIEQFKNPENRKRHSEIVKRSIIEHSQNPNNKRVILEGLKQALLEERISPMQPPAIREEEFLAINTEQNDRIRDYFNPFIRQLHVFLNQLPCLYDIQLFRTNWKYHTVDIKAFGNFIVKPHHWYTYNHGGRKESQFNIGLYKDYLRIGLGFEFTKAQQGNPELVRETYENFLKIIRQDLEGFRRFINECSLEVEWGASHDKMPRIVSTANAVEWLLNPHIDAIWIFVGRLLDRNQDARILSDAVVLGSTIESVFEGFRPIWEKTQIMTRRLAV